MSPSSGEIDDDVLGSARAGGLVMRGAVLRVLGFVAGSVLALLSAIVVTRHFGPGRFGQYTTILTVGALATQLMEGGLTTLTTREFAVQRGGAERTSRLRELLGLQLVTMSVAVLLATAFAIAAGYGAARIVAMTLATLGLGLALLQGTLAVPLVADLRFGLVSVIELIRQASLIVVIVALVLADAGLLPIAAALVPSSLLVLLITLRLTRGEFPLRPALAPGAWRLLLASAAALSIAAFVGSLYGVAAQILTSLVTNAHQLGLYSVAFRVFAVVAATGGLIATSAYPLLARAAHDDRERLAFGLQRVLDLMLAFGLLAAIITIVGPVAVIDVIAGSKYAGAAAALRLQGIALLGTAMVAPAATGIIALRHHRVLVLASTVALILTASLTLILASSDGARGASIASAAGEWALAAILLGSLVRADRRLHPRGRTVTRLAIVATPAFAVILLGLPSGLALALALAIYLGGVLLLRAYPSELLELLPARVRARARQNGRLSPSE